MAIAGPQTIASTAAATPINLVDIAFSMECQFVVLKYSCYAAELKSYMCEFSCLIGMRTVIPWYDGFILCINRRIRSRDGKSRMAPGTDSPGGVESVGQQPPASGRGGRHRRLDTGQSRLQRRFFGVIERGLHHCAPLALEALKHLICGDFAHQHE